MEFSLEVVVWFAISLALGTLLLSFVLGVDYSEFYDSLKSFFTDEERRIKGKTINETIVDSLEFWKSCGFGDIAKNASFFIDEEGELTKDLYFDRIKRWKMCNEIAYEGASCGIGDELVMNPDPIDTPKIIRAECDPVNKKLLIFG